MSILNGMGYRTRRRTDKEEDGPVECDDPKWEVIVDKEEEGPVECDDPEGEQVPDKEDPEEVEGEEYEALVCDGVSNGLKLPSGDIRPLSLSL